MNVGGNTDSVYAYRVTWFEVPNKDLLLLGSQQLVKTRVNRTWKLGVGCNGLRYARHEVPSHSPDSLPSTNFCLRPFQLSGPLPLLLWPYRSQLHIAGRRRRAAAAAARATAGQR